MLPRLRAAAEAILTAGALIAVVTTGAVHVNANGITAGFAYLIAVLAVAVWRGVAAGVAGSLLATVALNYFFLPPVRTFHIADTSNWVALGAFLVTAIIASQLVTRARRRAVEAEARRREIEALYELSVDLFAASGTAESLDTAVSRALRTFGARGGGLLIEDRWIGSAADFEMYKLIGADTQSANASVPVMIGEHRAELIVYDTRADRSALQAIARLIALAVERETFIEQRARLEALTASHDLKTSILRAVSHDLSTPLTTITLQVSALRRKLAALGVTSTAAEMIEEQTRRLHRRIDNLLAMARLESGMVQPSREPTPAADLFRAARENLPLLRPTRIHIAENTPDLDVDPSLVLEILVNLMENADRASPPGVEIELQAASHPADAKLTRVEVLDRGEGLSDAGDTASRGLGLQIARAFAEAQGGRVELAPRDGGGTRAVIDLPSSPMVAS